MDKKQLRKEYKDRRAHMSRNQVVENSVLICRYITESDLFRRAKHIYAYAALGNEADLRAIAEKAWEVGKEVAYPRVHGDTMSYYQIRQYTELEEGNFGVLEPMNPDPVDWPDALILVPGVVFNRAGGRMGFGKGYYDKYLSGHEYGATIGVSYELQFSDELILEEHDVPLQYMASEKGIWKAVR